jgi:hypothetical protein
MKRTTGLFRGGSVTDPPDGLPDDVYGPQPPTVEPGGPQSRSEAAAQAAQARRADALDYADETDPGPLRTVNQNGEPVQVASSAAATAPTNGQAQPAANPAALGIGALLLLGLAMAPKRH